MITQTLHLAFCISSIGHRGSSVARLEEAKQRSELYTRLHDLDVHVKRKVQFVHTKFGDTPSFQVC